MGILFNSLIGRAMGIALLLAIAFGGVQTVRVAWLKSDLASIKVKLQTCESNLKQESENRESERSTSVENAARGAVFCRVERQSALVAGREIQGIVDGKNEDGSRRSELVTADELRRVVSEN